MCVCACVCERERERLCVLSEGEERDQHYSASRCTGYPSVM